MRSISNSPPHQQSLYNLDETSIAKNLVQSDAINEANITNDAAQIAQKIKYHILFISINLIFIQQLYIRHRSLCWRIKIAMAILYIRSILPSRQNSYALS